MSLTLQDTLTPDAPVILDATCSDKKIWPREATIRMDVRREVKPDIVADARYLPFRPGVFHRVNCDPPHLIDKDRWEQDKPKYSRWFVSVNRHREGFSHQHILHSYRRYGLWHSREEWLAFLEATNNEFARVLKQTGVLEYKIGETKAKGRSVKVDELIVAYTNFEETRRKITQSNVHNPTYWLTMKPKPLESTPPDESLKDFTSANYRCGCKIRKGVFIEVCQEDSKTFKVGQRRVGKS